MPTFNFKYRELLQTGGVWRGASLNPRSRCLNKVAVAFIENVFRTDSFVSLPAELVARIKTGKSSNDARSTVGVEYINNLLTSGDTGMIQSMEHLLSSVVIESWTTFETLTPDLWIAAVNGGPAEFAQRVNNAVPFSAKEQAQAIPKGWQDKQMYDPRENFAASQIESGKVSLSRLKKIIHWYGVTFENGVQKLFKEIEDGYIFALSAYRNALVHNGGNVDKDFIRGVQSVDNLRGTFQEGERLRLDGKIVQKLRTAGIVVGQRLIQFVDDLISPIEAKKG
jgi:hypothetical protein